MTKKLCKEIETALHRQMKTPKDFDFLKERIYERLNILVSSTTLKRIWGYLDEGVTPREKTLDVLTQFLGYRDWEEYTQHANNPKESQSSPVMNRKISVKEDLALGDSIRLTWQPDRVCDIEYLGDLTFKVIDCGRRALVPRQSDPRSNAAYSLCLWQKGRSLVRDNPLIVLQFSLFTPDIYIFDFDFKLPLPQQSGDRSLIFLKNQ